MNKELVIHLTIGTAAVAVIYWLYKRLQPATVVLPGNIAQQVTTDMSTGTPGDDSGSMLGDILAPGIID